MTDVSVWQEASVPALAAPPGATSALGGELCGFAHVRLRSHERSVRQRSIRGGTTPTPLGCWSSHK
ncbi:hypothetical protein EYF80_059636 [Liparis tanakae]|uniref:Uncharacterized protein n=1 Tax=Liparis tanakae TaxID=230148 RepID=A0A4Z2EP38_9TELE|nr:hypothetical protein EYF80_059636 [Liparis tanakae]